MTDPNYFAGADERLKALEKPRRWCKCGHIEATHFGGFTEVFGADGISAGSYQAPETCHAKECTCTEFRPKRKWFKR